MACYRRRNNKGTWTKPEWFTFYDAGAFWAFLISKTRDRTRLYFFAHNGAFDLPVLAAFTQLPARGFKLTKAIVDAPPIDMTWRNESRSIRFIDTLNIWRMPLAVLGDSVGLRKLRMPRPEESEARQLAYCRRDVKVIMLAVLNWLDFLKTNDLGGFKPTLASQAFGTYRHRFMPHEIFIHDNERALDVERNSYVGGRCECFRLGSYDGPFYYLDVNSMYPSVMKSNLYPCKLLSCYKHMTLDDLERRRYEFAMIADVTIRTREADYPLVHDKKLVFPVGEFRVCLAGPEFWAAFDAGHVVQLHRVALYEQAELFTEYVDYVYGERLKAKAAGNIGASFNFKVLANSLYGKFGQRGRRFETVDECDPNIVDIEQWIDYDNELLVTRRSFGGIVQEWITEGEAYHSFPAIASYVTSYARRVLAEAVNTADRENCYYCDTDSLVVNQDGWDKLQHLVDANRLGAWKLETTLERMTLYGPKDYIFDDVQRVKGVRANAVWLSSSVVEQDQFVGFRGLVRHGSLDAPIVKRIRKKQHRIYTKGIPDATGRVSPLEIG